MLTALGLGLSLGMRPPAAVAEGGFDCPEEGECTFLKPNVLILVEYSTSMNTIWDQGQQLTRWDVVTDTIAQQVQPGSFLSQNTHLALMRFGHDPSPDPDTPIPGDGSGLVDGQVLDVAWDDAEASYFPCNGQALVDSLEATPAPLDGAATGIEAWTAGALERAAAEVVQTKADHPADFEEVVPRPYTTLVITDGPWTSPGGDLVLGPPEADPAIPAAQLFDQEDVITHVIYVDQDTSGLASANALAAAGGTGQAGLAPTPEDTAAALTDHTLAIIDSVIAPACAGGQPRYMILLDASSTMLNVPGSLNDPITAGELGETPWDMVRAGLVGPEGLFEGALEMADVVELGTYGLAVYGDELPAPGEQQLLLQYSRCPHPNFDWALNPHTSCAEPGCADPWAGPPITWTPVDSDEDEGVFFANQTLSHMPRCDHEGGTACAGSGAYLHLGLQTVRLNHDFYSSGEDPELDDPVDESTHFTTILITGSGYEGYSTDAQVQAEFDALLLAGVQTRVIGVGPFAQWASVTPQLEQLADWGSGGTQSLQLALTQAELEAALLAIVSEYEYDQCCAWSDCTPYDWSGYEDPEADTETDTGGTTETDSDSSTETDSGSDSDSDSSTGGSAETESETGSESTGSPDEGADELGPDEGLDDEVGTGEGGPQLINNGGCSCSTAEPDRPPRELGLPLGLAALALLRRRSRSSRRG
ncbi:hypothetical protein PPSIR1_01974 [Plesiocystis pacifica SIR-1]|uniref:VWFA domain-containing protein n=1 Tax=Plesiocystis pacifica SIR-1 TaxID=391625 RepID=A6G8A7_9BACT|nr:hypothetical protein PPSIR1_01974 [Plesiocystis pacifica SIR-1]